MIITATEFADWKSNPVTKAFFAACNVRVEDAKETLALQAGINPTEDNFLRGFVYAYREMPNFHIDDLEEIEVDPITVTPHSSKT